MCMHKARNWNVFQSSMCSPECAAQTYGTVSGLSPITFAVAYGLHRSHTRVAPPRLSASLPCRLTVPGRARRSPSGRSARPARPAALRRADPRAAPERAGATQPLPPPPDEFHHQVAADVRGRLLPVLSAAGLSLWTRLPPGTGGVIDTVGRNRHSDTFQSQSADITDARAKREVRVFRVARTVRGAPRRGALRKRSPGACVPPGRNGYHLGAGRRSSPPKRRPASKIFMTWGKVRHS